MNRLINIGNEFAYECKHYENYFITKSGILYSIYCKGKRGKTDIHNPHIVKSSKDKDGYYRVVLSYKGIKKYITIHRLMIDQWFGGLVNGYVTNHIDGDKTNNKLSNLEVITIKGNTVHAHEHGLVRHTVKIIVHDNTTNKEYKFNSMAKCMRILPDISRQYLFSLRSNKIFDILYFEKSDDIIVAYYNGEVYNTYKTQRDIEREFDLNRGRIYSIIHNCEYRKLAKKYKIVFL